MGVLWACGYPQAFGHPRAVGSLGLWGSPGPWLRHSLPSVDGSTASPRGPLFVSSVPEVSSSPGDEGAQAQSSQWTRWCSPDLSPLGSET